MPLPPSARFGLSGLRAAITALASCAWRACKYSSTASISASARHRFQQRLQLVYLKHLRALGCHAVVQLFFCSGLKASSSGAPWAFYALNHPLQVNMLVLQLVHHIIKPCRLWRLPCVALLAACHLWLWCSAKAPTCTLALIPRKVSYLSTQPAPQTPAHHPTAPYQPP